MLRGLALALALLAACVQPTNASVLAVFRFDSAAVKTDHLTVQVKDPSGTDLLPPREISKDGGLLEPGDTLRIYFEAPLVKRQADVRALAYSVPQPPYLPNGLPIAGAVVAFEVPALNTEKTLEVTLSPIGDLACPPLDGGSCCAEDPTTGEFVGLPLPTATRRTPGAVDLQPCGAAGKLCVACNPLSADTCVQGTCLCGTGAPCEADQFCLDGACVCSPLNCFGCCKANRCVAPQARGPQQCGGGAVQCVACAAGTSCTNGALCGAGCPLCGPAQCCSGTACESAGHPRCRAVGSNACETCDSLRSNTCKLNGGCACGLTDACRPDQRCQQRAGVGFECRSM